MLSSSVCNPASITLNLSCSRNSSILALYGALLARNLLFRPPYLSHPPGPRSPLKGESGGAEDGVCERRSRPQTPFSLLPAPVSRNFAKRGRGRGWGSMRQSAKSKLPRSPLATACFWRKSLFPAFYLESADKKLRRIYLPTIGNVAYNLLSVKPFLASSAVPNMPFGGWGHPRIRPRMHESRNGPFVHSCPIRGWLPQHFVFTCKSESHATLDTEVALLGTIGGRGGGDSGVFWPPKAAKIPLSKDSSPPASGGRGQG